MSKFKHTPGPWTYKQRRGNNIYEYVVFKQETGHILAEQDVQANPELNEANAKLIAAAPDMLDALRAISQWHKGYGTKTQGEMIRDYVEPAIKKATE